MSTFKLTINKGNMVSLLRNNGYTPSLKRARFRQRVKPAAWELFWKEPRGEHSAVIAFAAGRVSICITCGGKDTVRTITPVELRRFGMAQDAGTLPQ